MTGPSGAGTWTSVEVANWTDFDGDFPDDEPLGSKEKFWVSDSVGQRWLFKFARERNGVMRGEDWAECLVHELAKLIGVPTAEVCLATCEGRRGVLSRSVVRPGERLEHGNELLASVDPDYDRAARRENPGYSVVAVHASLAGVTAPPDAAELAGMSGFDVFCGYLLLDAWVAGRDRHHENWAAIRSEAGRSIAPSFDHGNALGFQESDEHRRAVLQSVDGVRRWAEHGRSQHFAGKPLLVDLANEAFAQASERARTYWIGALGSVARQAVEMAVSAVPDDVLSDIGRTFCRELLLVNRERFLNADQRRA